MGDDGRQRELQTEFEALVGQGSEAMAKAHGYARSDPVTGTALSPDDERTLHRMLLERVYAKRLRRFEAADALRAQLHQAGVAVDDREKTFRLQPARAAPATPTEHGYVRGDDGGSVVLSAADQATLDQLLLERVLAKRKRDFVRADEINAQLKEAGVYVHDRERFYRLSVPRSQKAAAQEMPTHHGYTRVGTDETVVVSPADQVTLDQMLLQRVIAKRTRDCPTADQLRTQLKEAGVRPP